MTVKFAHSQQIAENIRMFWFRPPKPVNYIAGQFIELTLPHDNADQRGQKRWFTLSSSPSEPLLAITTKFTHPDGSTFKQALHKLQPDTELHMSNPMGDFVLPKDTNIPLLFVAGGIGVTPVRSMVKWLSDTGEKRKISLLYAASKQSEFAFEDIFRLYGCNIIKLSSDNDGAKAHLTADSIVQLANPSDKTRIYLSGPEPMIESLVEQFAKIKTPYNLVTDYFPGYQPI